MNAKQRRKARRELFATDGYQIPKYAQSVLLDLRVVGTSVGDYSNWCGRCWSKIKFSDERHGEGHCDEAMTLEEARSIAGSAR